MDKLKNKKISRNRGLLEVPIGCKGLVAKKIVATLDNVANSQDISITKAFMTGFLTNILNPIRRQLTLPVSDNYDCRLKTKFLT
jgi:hypothetical protein